MRVSDTAPLDRISKIVSPIRLLHEGEFHQGESGAGGYSPQSLTLSLISVLSDSVSGFKNGPFLHVTVNFCQP